MTLVVGKDCTAGFQPAPDFQSGSAGFRGRVQFFDPRLLACFLPTVLLLSSCGNVGEPMYPSLNIPTRIVDLKAVERGSVLVVTYTIPALTTDGVVVRNLQSSELSIGDKTITVDKTKPGAVSAEVPVAGLPEKEVAVRVRLINARGRASDWSNSANVTILAPLAAPTQLKADLAPGGVKLTWSAPGESHFRVFRKTVNETASAQIGESDSPQYVDNKTEFGKTYEYAVQAANGTAESEVSNQASILTKQAFPPAVPSGLSVSPGLNTAELAWDRNTESDFQGYRVYRSVDGGAFERIADLIESPNYSDAKVQAGKRYRYTVSAVNQSGLESQQSAPVEISM